MHGTAARTSPPGPGKVWTLRLLGPPALLAPESGVVLPLRPKDAVLLAAVALSSALRAEQLAAMLWPGSSLRQASTSLRQRLFRLRRDTGATLVNTGLLLQRADDLDTDLALALAQLDENEHAPCGDLLADLDYDDLPELAVWLEGERARWRERRVQALAEAAAKCEQRGAVVRALGYAQRLVEMDPLNEHAHRRLMRLHYLRGDGASALAVFERLERSLKDELGARPSAETIELMSTVERGAARLPARRAVAPASLLRPPRLIGRDADLERLNLAWSARRVFVLLGEAGIGKTRLLQDFAADRPDIAVVQARPGDAGIAYAVIARLLRAVLAQHADPLPAARREALALVLPELGAPVDVAGQAQRFLLGRAVEATLVDAVTGGLQAAIVDDLHFADEASLEFLQALVESGALAPLQWGFAQRAADTGTALARLHHALEEAGRIESVTLQPLDGTQLLALVDSLGLPELDAARLAPALLKHTGGNPMFSLETLKDLVLSPAGASGAADAPLPQPVTVGALVQRRLAQLSPAALRLARAAHWPAPTSAPSWPPPCWRRTRWTSPSRGASWRPRRSSASRPLRMT